jgi:excisionase family DNA binding protein
MPSSKKNKNALPFPAADQRWLTIYGAAAYTQLSSQNIRNRIHAGELRASRIGVIYRIDRNDLDQFMLSRKKTVAPYRKGTRPWIAAMHARNRKAGAK